MADTQQRLSSSQTTSVKLPASSTKPQWLLWALGSGAFAATNGVFAKLTTAESTHHLSTRLGDSLVLEYALRAVFFGLNLLSNAIMWILFTRALTAATSTTRVSILNTGANFLVTAIYGLIIFGEGLSMEWLLGAALLVAGCVVIGRREGVESGSARSEESEGTIRLDGEERTVRKIQEDQTVVEGEDGDEGESAAELYRDEAEEEVRKEREVWEHEG